MIQRKRRRFRHHPNGRDQRSHMNGYMQTRQRSNSFSNIPTRNNFRTTQSAEKLLEKYNTLAKEAISSGDKTLVENYLQHADHFARIIEDKNKNQNKANIIDKPIIDDKHPSENSDAKRENVTKNKE